MAAKLITWAPTRKECIELTLEVLDNYHLAGFKTTILFCRLTINSEPFRSGNYSTGFVKDHWPLPWPEGYLDAVAAIATGGFVQEQERRLPVV